MKTIITLSFVLLVAQTAFAQLPGVPKVSAPKKETSAGLTADQVAAFVKFHQGMQNLTPEERAFFKDPANLKKMDAPAYAKIGQVAADAGLENTANAHAIMLKTSKAYSALQTQKANKLGVKVNSGVPDGDLAAVRAHERDLDAIMADYISK
jgi:hypothetical protein